MKQTVLAIKDKLVELRKWDKSYKKLRRHLHKMPVGYPGTFSGVERRLLKAMFTVDEAELAVFMDYRFESAAAIHTKARHTGITEERVAELLGKSPVAVHKSLRSAKYHLISDTAAAMKDMVV